MFTHFEGITATILAEVKPSCLPVVAHVCKEWRVHVDKTKICTIKCTHLATYAVKKGNMDLFHWAEQNGFPTEVSDMAARKGNMELLKSSVPTINTAKAATAKGQIKALEWILGNHNIQYGHLADIAVINNRLETLQWLIEHGHFVDDVSLARAVVTGNDKVTQLLLGIVEPGIESYHSAIAYGNLEVLNKCPIKHIANHTMWTSWYIRTWAQDNGCPFKDVPSSVQWARERGFNYDGNVCSIAALGGHIHVIQWLIEHNVNVPNEWTSVTAATGGQLETLNWLKSNGYPFNEWVLKEAERLGHKDIINYLKSN